MLNHIRARDLWNIVYQLGAIQAIRRRGPAARAGGAVGWVEGDTLATGGLTPYVFKHIASPRLWQWECMVGGLALPFLGFR